MANKFKQKIEMTLTLEEGKDGKSRGNRENVRKIEEHL